MGKGSFTAHSELHFPVLRNLFFWTDFLLSTATGLGTFVRCSLTLSADLPSMSEPMNGGPASHEAADPSPAAHPEPMDTTADEPRAEVCPQLSLLAPASALTRNELTVPCQTQPLPTSQPEASAQSEANPQTNAPAPPPTNATASPKPEPTPTGADNQLRPGAQTVREVLNTKINPFVSAGLRQIFQDPANMYVRPGLPPASSFSNPPPPGYIRKSTFG